MKIWTWANTILIRSISNFYHENFKFDKNNYKKTKAKYYCNAISKEFKKKKKLKVYVKIWNYGVGKIAEKDQILKNRQSWSNLTT